MTPYEHAKIARLPLEAAVKAAGQAVRAFPRGPNGLTPDSVKTSPEFAAAKRVCDLAFAALREFNGSFVRAYKKEIRAERAKRFDVA